MGAQENNLKNIDVDIPLGVMTCVTGVSGSGKSSLVNEIVYKRLARELNRARTIPGKHKDILGMEQLDKVIDIDQSPIGRTPRSNPATYTGVFDLIRDLFAATPDAKARGYKKGRFSFNVKGGRVRGLQRGRYFKDRDAFPSRCICALRGLRRKAVQQGDAGSALQGKEHLRCAEYDGGGGPGVL